MAFEDSTTFTPSDDYTWREADGDITVLNLETGEYLTFTGIGSDLWREFAAGKTLAETVQFVIDSYDVDKQQAKNDIMNFATGLIQKGVLAE